MAWYAKQVNSYSRQSIEAIANATETISTLRTYYNFSFRSCCAILGNIGDEGGYNPWRWQGDNVQNVNSISATVGYGLFQYTPPTKYINSDNYNAYYGVGYAPNFSDQVGSPNDGNAQLHYMGDNFYSTYANSQYNYQQYKPYWDQAGIDIDNFYWITDDEMKTGVYESTGTEISIANLTGAFMLCWERPSYSGSASHYNRRVDDAVWWWEQFHDDPPGPGPGPGPGPDPPTPPPYNPPGKMKLWMMLRHFL